MVRPIATIQFLVELDLEPTWEFGPFTNLTAPRFNLLWNQWLSQGVGQMKDSSLVKFHMAK